MAARGVIVDFHGEKTYATKHVASKEQKKAGVPCRMCARRMLRRYSLEYKGYTDTLQSKTMNSGDQHKI